MPNPNALPQAGGSSRPVPSIPIYYMVSATATSSRLAGFTGKPSNAGDGWNIAQWQLTP